MLLEDVESRFAHLLRPIRDLTKNWNIDITAQLEEYLQEIENITITFDGGATTMNFAEAALLIQGSAYVYSKKVEYLHTLVFQVLEMLANKKKLQKAQKEGEEQQEDESVPDDVDEQFPDLSLDDRPQIELKEDFEGVFTVATMPLMPISLIKVEEDEKKDCPLMSVKGEVLASRRDFKVNTCLVHNCGTLLLDLSHLPILELFLQTLADSDTQTDEQVQQGTNTHTADTAPPADQPQDASLHTSNTDTPLLDEGPGDMDIEDDNDGGLLDNSHHDDRPRANRQRQAKSRYKNNVFVSTPNSETSEWKVLDPHEKVNSVDKPYRKGRTYKVPKCLISDSKKRKHDGETKHDLKPFTQFCEDTWNVGKGKTSSNPLKVLQFREFEHLFWKEFARRQEKLKEKRRLLAAKGKEIEEEDDQNEGDANADAFGVEDDNYEEVDFQVPEVHDLGPLGQGHMLGHNQDQPEDPYNLEDVPPIHSYEELVRLKMEEFFTGAQNYATLSERARRVSDWEEKLLPRLEEEEQHEPFDIHVYGSRVIDKLEPENEPENTAPGEQYVPFKKVVVNKDPFEVCRLFLATLQLANAYNVEIESAGDLDHCVDTLKLKLLSKQRHHQALEEYRAPSLED